jgi:predicted transcriptional regulator of viral defense system
MRYTEFYREFKVFEIFSTSDIHLVYPDFDNRRLVEWQKKGYITKIRKEFYYFSDVEINESFLNRVANKIYKPSYISLESALSYYGFIPEGVFSRTSMTSRNTVSFNTVLGSFSYHHLKPTFFFGYKIVENQNGKYTIAEPEKALLDFLYIRKPYDIETINGMRFNEDRINEVIDYKILDDYLSVFRSVVLNRRIRKFKKMVNA